MHWKSGGSRKPIQEIREEVPNVRCLLSEQAEVGVHCLCSHWHILWGKFCPLVPFENIFYEDFVCACNNTITVWSLFLHVLLSSQEIRLKYGFKLRLTDLLIKPIQRLTKYHMLLEVSLERPLMFTSSLQSRIPGNSEAQSAGGSDRGDGGGRAGLPRDDDSPQPGQWYDGHWQAAGIWGNVTLIPIWLKSFC